MKKERECHDWHQGPQIPQDHLEGQSGASTTEDQRYQQAQLDAQGFQARTEAFSANGVAAVRAALVQKLTGISFVIAPPPQNPAPNPAQTIAYSEPIQ